MSEQNVRTEEEVAQFRKELESNNAAMEVAGHGGLPEEDLKEMIDLFKQGLSKEESVDRVCDI